MPAPLSIIIPTYNSEKTIGPTLACLFEGVNAGLVHELIFADGGSNDRTKQIANDVGAEFFTTNVGRGTQMRAAAESAKAPWLLFIHSDTILSPEWVDEVRKHILTSKKAGYGKLAFNSTHPFAHLIAMGANVRSKTFGLPYGDQTLLVSKTLYESVGGFADIPLMEDVKIARSLKGNLKGLRYTAVTSASKYERNGWFSQAFKNLETLVGYFLGKDPNELSKRYRN